MLELQSVSAGYRTASNSIAAVLQDISLRLGRGEALAVVGTSGSGKSTLLRVVAGTLTPSSGCVMMKEEVQSSIWLSPQSPVLIEFRTALQNATLGRELTAQLDRDDVDAAVMCLSELGLDASMYKKATELSGGMRRRVAMAQALVAGRNLTLLDEPFAELDGIARQYAERALHKRRKPDASLIIVTHDLDSVCAVCDRALVLAGPPSFKATMIEVSENITAYRDPSKRRNAPGFSDAVADLHRQVVEAA